MSPGSGAAGRSGGVNIFIDSERAAARRAFAADVVPALQLGNADTEPQSDALQRFGATDTIMHKLETRRTRRDNQFRAGGRRLARVQDVDFLERSQRHVKALRDF